MEVLTAGTSAVSVALAFLNLPRLDRAVSSGDRPDEV